MSRIIFYHATQTVELFHILWRFRCVIICSDDDYIEILITLIISTFIS